MGGALFYKSTFLVSCTRMSHDPVEHTSNSTVTTCADGTTEHTENEGLGVNICCSSVLALYQTGNNDGKRWNFPVVPPVEPVSLERSDFEEQQEEEDGILKYDSQVMMMTFHLWNERLIFTLITSK